MDKLLTIIVPTYNMEQLLDRCLTSLIIEDNDLFKLLEVIVVNDGSKDRSSEIAHKYESQYPEVFIVIDKENGNYGSCVNCALKVATGKYAKMLDADDYYNTGEFQKFLDRLRNVDVDIVLSDHSEVRGDDITPLNRTFDDGRIFDITTEQDVNDIGLWMTHNIAIKTDILHDIEYYQTEGISYTDNEWIFYPLFNAKQCMYMKLNVYNYVLGRDGQTISPKAAAKGVGAVVKIGLRMIEYYKKFDKSILAKGQVILLKKYIASLYDYEAKLVFYNLPVSNNRSETFSKLDVALKQLPEIYDMTGKQCSGHYYYVQYWRKQYKDMRKTMIYGARELLACCLGRRAYKFKDIFLL